MIIKNGEVFQEDGSFQIQDLYVENHKIVATEAEVTDKTVIDARCFRDWWMYTATVHLATTFPMQTRRGLRLF